MTKNLKIIQNVTVATAVAFYSGIQPLLAQVDTGAPAGGSPTFRMRLPRERQLTVPEQSQPVPQITVPEAHKSCTDCVTQERISRLYFRDSEQVLFQATAMMSAKELVEAALKSGVSLKKASFKNLDLSQVNLTDQDLGGCDLTCTEFGQATLDGCNFKGAAVSRTCFVQAHLQGAIFDNVYVYKSKFGQARMQAATFNGATLKDDDFCQAEAANIQFKNCTFENTTLGQLQAEKSSFVGSQITGTDFVQAKLTDVDFKSVNCADSKFGQAMLEGADLSGSSFDQCDFVQTTVNKNTLMPDTRYEKGLLRHRLGGLQIIKTH